MADIYLKFTKRIDRRSPRNEGDPESPYLRENWLARDNVLRRPAGTEKVITNTLTGIPTWAARYYTVETGQISPKTFAYGQDGTLWHINELAKTAINIKSGLNINAYPRHQLFKTQTQTKMYSVDGKDLYVYDGNNDNLFKKVDITDTTDASINPIDLIEHLDRLILISNTYVYISKNLNPEIFSDSTDCIQLIVGSGKGKNLAVKKLDETVFILNTEGIFAIIGDTISAVASTFSLRFVDDKKIIAGRTAVKVEGAIVFLADDCNIWAFDGSSSKKLSHPEKLEDFFNTNRTMLNKAAATYHDNYYKLSFVEKGHTTNNLEVWWDALEDKIDFVRGRNVSCYMESDSTEENLFQILGRSDANTFMWTDRGNAFDGEPINVKLWTRDITPKKGWNVRFTAFYPEIEPIGDRNIIINYILDGKLAPEAYWTQNLQGDTKGLGLITIKNQSQTTHRVRPKINYAKGTSIAFYINDNTLNLRTDFVGMGIEYIVRERKKGRKVGA